MPEEIAAKLQELGRVIDAPKTEQLYAPLQGKEPYQGVKVERDVKYGAADRQSAGCLHAGGGFVAPASADLCPRRRLRTSDKRAPGSPFNDNIMLWAVRNGYIGVNATYRLAPQAVWPSGAEIWPRRFNGFRIIWRAWGRAGTHLSDGHSMGAVHVADYVSRPELHKVKGGGLAGAILVSGIYDMPATAVMITEFISVPIPHAMPSNPRCQVWCTNTAVSRRHYAFCAANLAARIARHGVRDRHRNKLGNH